MLEYTYMGKILITGAGGYIGSVATHLFLDRGYEVVAIDNFSTGYRDPLDKLSEKFGGLTIYEKNLKDGILDILEKEKTVEAVIHYAASCSVNESMENPYKYFSNNTASALQLINDLVTHNITKFVFSSTCAVYGAAEHMPISEDTKTHPTNPYGESKRMTEELLAWYGQLKGLQYVVLRYFNVCGATDDGAIGDSKKPSVHLVQNAVRGALGIQPFFLTCPEVATPDKTPIRDYVNVVDLNIAHVKALEYLSKGGKSEVINIGTGTGNSVLEIIQEVEKQTGKKLSLDRASAARKGEYPRAVADITKAEKILSWKPGRSIKDSISSLISWYETCPNGWSK